MFLCEECHKEAGCTLCSGLELLKSYGACEMCHKVTTCYDCHNYDFRSKEDIEQRNKVLEVDGFEIGIEAH